MVEAPRMREKGWIMSVKLTDTQLVMLSAAAKRKDHCLGAPDKLKGAIRSNVGDKLVKLGLVREVRAKAGMPVWRQDDAGQSSALKLTAAGLKAVAVDEASEEPIGTSKWTRPQPQLHPDAANAQGPDIGEHTKTPRTGSKLARIIDLLQRSEGATVLHLMEATGWLPHTTRAALTGLRKRGYAVVRERIDEGNSIYRIASAAADSGERVVVDRDCELRPKASQAA
jgi:hypothetical protein